MFAALLDKRTNAERENNFKIATCAAQGDEKSVKKMERSLNKDG